MAPSNRNAPTKEEFDMLENMLDRLSHSPQRAEGQPPSRPSSIAFPARSSSRASSTSGQLSARSSNRSLQSLNSLHAPSLPDRYPARPSSALATHSAAPPPDADDEETTPSMTQGEWGADQPQRPTLLHARSHQSSFGADGRQQNDSSQLYARDDSSLQPAFSTSRSTPVSPVTRPRTPNTSHPERTRNDSPRRLLPRSPLNNRTPLEDLAYFREVGAVPVEAPRSSWDVAEPELGDTDSLRSARSAQSGSLSVASAGVNGRPTSMRSARLRDDIEKEVQRFKKRESHEEFGKVPPFSSSTTLDDAFSPPDRTSASSASYVPLHPGAPKPVRTLAHAPSSPSLRSDDDTRSIRSVGSASNLSLTGASSSWNGHPTSSTASFHSAGASGSGSGSGHTNASARTEYGVGGAERGSRTRQKESREWSQNCWVWQTKVVTAKESGSGGKFGKTPIMNSVPSALKRKSAKRESAHHLLSPAEALLFNVENDRKSSKDKEKDKEKKGNTAPMGANAIGREGGWRRATGVLRDDGYFRVFSDSDKAVIHSVHLPSLARTNVRLVDHSLFGRPNCISLSRKGSSPSTPHRSSFIPGSPSASSTTSSSLHSSAFGKADEPLFLCFPSVVATQVWLVMAHCFTRPEFYLANGVATPRMGFAQSRGAAAANAFPGYPSDSGTESDAGSMRSFDGGSIAPSTPKTDELDSSCRIYRSLVLSIQEGRALGDLATEVVRPGPKSSWERPAFERGESDSSFFSPSGGGGGGSDLGHGEASPARGGVPRLQSRQSSDPRGSGGGGVGEKEGEGGIEAFCEIEMGGEIVGRTSVRKGTGPFWNETFTFSDLPPFVSPIIIRVLTSSKHSSRPTLLGTTTVRIPDLPRHELVEDWWSIKPAVLSKSSDVVGELSLSLRIGEEVVLPSRDYGTMLKMLSDDADAELATDIAHEFPSDLEEVTKILLRIYQADAQLVPRILRLADLEIDSNSRNNRSAAILFRGNTILTKSVELYLRLIGSEYLDASIGEAIRRICAEKVEIEIDPMKLKPGTKDKELQHNVQLLHDWTLTVWNSIYDAREKCPHDLRRIFGHIQHIVVEKYGNNEEQKNTRWTCVSAFIFLRFFVPAVLNPKLFFIVSTPPDPKSQRTLTLVAKTLQGLANFSSFGQKEPFMLPMNSFVQDNTAAFVDFIENISNSNRASGYRQEWTSLNAAAYLAPYRLRNSLPPIEKEGVPLLPHLIDLPRELGLLASHIHRFVLEKGPLTEDGAAITEGRSETPVSISSSRGGRSRRFIDLAEACVDVHVESRRRGGGLVSRIDYTDARNRTPDPKAKGRKPLTSRGATGSFASGAASLRKALGVAPPSRGGRKNESPNRSSEELHIRQPASLPPPVPAPPPPLDLSSAPSSSAADHRREESFESSRSSITSRRDHRSYTINGPGLAQQAGSYPVQSFSEEDLSLLAAIKTPPLQGDFDEREAAGSPYLGGGGGVAAVGGEGRGLGMTTSGTVTSFSHVGVSGGGDSFMVDDEEFSPLNPGPQEPLFGGGPFPSRRDFPQTVAETYSFPPAPSSSSLDHEQRSRAPAMAKADSSASVRSNSTSRSNLPPIAPPPPTARIRITQESTTTVAYVSEGSPALSPAVPAVDGEDLSLAPTSHEDGTPYESSFGGFVAPAMRQTNSQASGRSMTSSLSSMSISAEVSVGPTGFVGLLQNAGRRTSSAGFALGWGAGSTRKGSVSGSRGGGGEEDTGSENSRNGGGGKGLFGRRKGSKGS